MSWTYLRDGGQLPTNLPADEDELERVYKEFDYFMLPPPWLPS